MPRDADNMTDMDDPIAPPRGTHNANPPGIGFWALVAEDFRTNDSDFFSQGFWALFWHRFGNWRMGIRPRPLRMPLSVLYKVMFKLCEWICGIMLPYTVRVGRRVRLDHFGGMILVAEEIGSDVTIRQNTSFGIASVRALHARPRIGDHVDVGTGAVIVGGITVGRGAVVGANAVVSQDVPPYAVVGGVPARVIRMRSPSEIGDPTRLHQGPVLREVPAPGFAGPPRRAAGPPPRAPREGM
jgi:serine O-acetyltransferase